MSPQNIGTMSSEYRSKRFPSFDTIYPRPTLKEIGYPQEVLDIMSIISNGKSSQKFSGLSPAKADEMEILLQQRPNLLTETTKMVEIHNGFIKRYEVLSGLTKNCRCILSKRIASGLKLDTDIGHLLGMSTHKDSCYHTKESMVKLLMDETAKLEEIERIIREQTNLDGVFKCEEDEDRDDSVFTRFMNMLG